ncbi:MAG: ATP-dependent RecD-like DNA helicase [Bacillota bacterium]
MKLTGEVVGIIFRNEENMYSILEIDAGGLLEVVTGTFFDVSKGDFLELEGEYKDTKYGKQFVSTKVKTLPPQTTGQIALFLASGLFKGVGEATAIRIAQEFKNETFDVIEKDPSRLAKIRGISLDKAVAISNEYKKVKNMREALVFLQERGITSNLAGKIFAVYKEHTIRVITKNPYKLVEDVDGIGFKKADQIAGAMGITKDSEHRFRAGYMHLLKDVAQSEGNTCMKYSQLVEQGAFLLGCSDAVCSEIFEKLTNDFVIEKAIKVFTKEDEKFVALFSLYAQERGIATKLQDINQNNKQFVLDPEKDIQMFEKENKIQLHKFQIDAVKGAISSGVSVITGGPGTGKTTIIKCILYIFKNLRMNVGMVAPTGRAAKRMTEQTGEEAKTIHRMLDIDFAGGKSAFVYNEQTRLPHDVIIVDEVSMTDVYILRSLLSAVKFGAKVILVGDKDQLPSVGAGNVLKDIIESKTLNVFSLSYVYRQGKESLIIANAHKINNGIMPVLKDRTNDFFHSSIKEAPNILERIKNMMFSIPKFIDTTTDNIQVIAPMRKGVVGVNNINQVLQETLNEKRTGKGEIVLVRNVFREGDRVMHITNNYQMEWKRRCGDFEEYGTGIFNGDMGKIIIVDEKNKTITVEFDDGKLVEYSSGDFDELTLSYAITIHKSQGSEFDVVIIPITGGPPSLYSRNLLYTAITRAKKMVVLIGDNFNIRRMVENNYIEQRYTMLKDFLVGELT